MTLVHCISIYAYAYILWQQLSTLKSRQYQKHYMIPIVITKTDRFVRTYTCGSPRDSLRRAKRNSPFDKVLCAIKTIIKSAIQHLKSLSAGFDNFAFYTLIFNFLLRLLRPLPSVI